MLLGRQAECARLDGLIDLAQAEKSAVLVIRGEPGVGKSALLRYASERASAYGMTTLNARGIESESELSFANLADLIRPIRGALSAIPPAQSAVLSGALALGPPVPGDRFAACAATLSVLAASAEKTPVLVAVDDVQWLDASSAEALLFAARRLGTEGIAMLFTFREGEAMSVDLAGLPSLKLGGLDEAASMQLLTSNQMSVSARVATALHHAVRGNPLAMVEIPALLSEKQRSGVEALPDPLPAAPHLEQAFLRRVSTLPETAQKALLVAAASESTDVAILNSALEHFELPAQSLVPAESAGLIAVDGVEVRFRHPLIRSAVYQAATPIDRRRAHRALAAALEAEEFADRRAWHLAGASTEPDESVAAALEDAALRSHGRSGYGPAAHALIRSAELSPSIFERARRLLAAANASQLAGRPEEGLLLLDRAIATRPPERLRFEIQHLRATIEVWVRTPMAAHHIMVREADQAQQQNPADAAMFLAEAAIPCIMGGDIRLGLETSRRAKALADRVQTRTPLMIDAVLAQCMLLLGMAHEAQLLIDESMRRAIAIADEATVVTPLPQKASAVEAMRNTSAVGLLLALERHRDARALITGAVEAMRNASGVGLLPFALAVLSEVDFRTGNLAAAYAAGTESVRLANETGQGSAASFSLVNLARVEAAQGREADCRAHARSALELAGAHGLGTIFYYAEAALGLLELGEGHPAEALGHLEKTAQGFRESGIREPNLIQWQPDYIESLVRAGRTDDAVRALATLESDAERADRAWARATAARCRGFLSQDVEHFQRALKLHEHSPSPFEIARTQLCYGETLRRQRKRIEARHVLREALNTFERLGAEPWAARAHHELSATGEKSRKRNVAATRQLTPQELQIALAVAQGATNREAAAQLFISPKTVESHLSSAYRKLGARSRTELARIFANEAAATASPTS